jgi:hypothetical protein
MGTPWRSAVLIQIRKVQTLQCKCLPIATNAPWSVRDRHIDEDVEVPLQQSTNRGFRMVASCFEEPTSFFNLENTLLWVQTPDIHPTKVLPLPLPPPQSTFTSYSSNSYYDHVKALRQDGKSVIVSTDPFIVCRISML